MNDANSMRALLGPHLPYLRRYARALSGSQKSGDNYVRAVLESLVPSADNLADSDSPKRDLFRLFHAFFDPLRDAKSPVGDGGTAGLSNGGQQALLLTTVEGFTTGEAAEILGRSEADVTQAVSEARAAISEAMRSRVLIIEDEPIISMHLEQIVKDMGHEVVGTAMTRTKAVAEAQRAAPDLVLADIQLADGSSGLDAARDILSMFDIPVIFITAYPERLLTGERPEPTFLVTKPFEPETVIVTIGHALLARFPAFARAH